MLPYLFILPNLAPNPPISFQFNSNSNLQCGEGRFSQRHEEESIACAMDIPRGTVLVAPRINHRFEGERSLTRVAFGGQRRNGASEDESHLSLGFLPPMRFFEAERERSKASAKLRRFHVQLYIESR